MATLEPVPVEIANYSGDVMEPFVSPSGEIVLFNTRNGAGDKTELRWANRSAAGTFAYRGAVAGSESGDLTGVPSIDRAGELFFISPRAYDRTLETIYTAHFENGRASNVHPVPGLAAPRHGLVRFDSEISADGRRPLISEGTFDASGGPHSARLMQARRNGDGFAIDPDSERIFAAVNAGSLSYAGTLSPDRRTLYFTRAMPQSAPQIWRALRPDAAGPFGAPEKLEALGDFVEAPALGPDGHTLYFHRRDDTGHFGLFSVRAQSW